MHPYLDSPLVQAGMKWVGGQVHFMPTGEYAYVRYVDTRNLDFSMFLRFPNLAGQTETVFQLVLRPIDTSLPNVVVWEGRANSHRVGWSMPRQIFDTGLEYYTRAVDLIVASEAIAENHDYKYWSGDLFYYN